MRDNTDNLNKMYISWEQFGIDIDKLANLISLEAREFDSIYGIPRNGTIISSILSKMLNLKMVDYPDSTRTLIVDDISDSGKTLKEYKNKFNGNVIACIFYRQNTEIMPDIVVYDAQKDWIVFPFELNEK